MSKQTIALAYPRPADALHESEYQALLEALAESARGRSFLAEHARRSRSAETNILLTAIERIEAQVRPRPAAADPLHDDVRRVLDDMRTARGRIDNGGKVPKAEQLNALLDILQRRLGKLLAETQPSDDEPTPAPPPRPSAARWLDAPPEPAAADNDTNPTLRPTTIDIEVNPPRLLPVANLEPGAPQPPVFDIEAGIKAVVEAEVESKNKKPFEAAADHAEEALAAIMALSEEERIALFS